MDTSMQTVLPICGDELDKLAVTADKIYNITAPDVSSLEVTSVVTSAPLAVAITS